MELKIKKLDSDAKIPTKGNPGDAGIDFYTLEEVVFLPGAQQRIRTGIALEIPPGYVGLVWDKSSISFNNNLKTVGGVIDSGFRGEFIIGMVNLSSETRTIAKGQKIAQMIIQKFEDCDIVQVEQLSYTIRGEGGFGSTGKF